MALTSCTLTGALSRWATGRSSASVTEMVAFSPLPSASLEPFPLEEPSLDGDSPEDPCEPEFAPEPLLPEEGGFELWCEGWCLEERAFEAGLCEPDPDPDSAPPGGSCPSTTCTAVTRRAPGVNRTRPSSTLPVSGRPLALCQRRTAAAVASPKWRRSPIAP